MCSFSQTWLLLPHLLQLLSWFLPHCPVLTPLLSSALLCSLWQPLEHCSMAQPCPGSPSLSPPCSEALGQPVTLISVTPYGLWLHTPCAPSLVLVSLLRDHLLTVPPLLIQSTLFKAFCWGNTSFMPAYQILSSPQCWWLLVSAVILQVQVSSSLYPQSLPLPWMLFSCSSQTLPVSLFVPQAVSPSVFLQPFPPVRQFLRLSSLRSDCSASSSCRLSTAKWVTESIKEMGSCLLGLVPALPCSPCLLPALPSACNHSR